MTAPTMSGAEPFSHVGSTDVGVLVLHGFTGCPASVRGFAQSFAAADFHVELPQLAGHGTSMQDMLPTRWADWSGDAEAALQNLAVRASRIIVAGLSMGGSLTLWLAQKHSELRGIICVNPATTPLDQAVIDAIKGMIDGGQEFFEGVGNDIADPSQDELAYPDTPLAPLLSMQLEGMIPLAQQYGEITCPLLLFTSIQDHVVPPVDSDRLAAAYGGSVERVLLERSFHVATQDYDKELIFSSSLEFAKQVTATN